MKPAQKNDRVRINMVLDGEPAQWLHDLKQRGLISSYTDGVIQGLRALNEKITEQDLKLVQLRNLKNIGEAL